MTPFQMLEEIESTEDRATNLREKYLRKSGWEHTCQTPGSYWMWTKDIGGKLYVCTTKDAFDFQKHIDYAEMMQPHDAMLDEDGYCKVCGDKPGEFESMHDGELSAALGSPSQEKS